MSWHSASVWNIEAGVAAALTDELLEAFLAGCARHRAGATCLFYRSRLRTLRPKFAGRAFCSLNSLEFDECLAEAGAGMSDVTQHHNAVTLERMQKFALDHKLLDRPLFGKLEKPRVGQRDRVPPPAETEAILVQASHEFRLIYSALRQCGARPGELCRLTVADVDRAAGMITLTEDKTARKTGKPRRIPIGQKFGA